VERRPVDPLLRIAVQLHVDDLSLDADLTFDVDLHRAQQPLDRAQLLGHAADENRPAHLVHMHCTTLGAPFYAACAIAELGVADVRDIARVEAPARARSAGALAAGARGARPEGGE
jgi:hypothetical protein